MHVDTSEVTSVVPKHRGTAVLSDGRLSFCNGQESRKRGFELVNADHSSWYVQRFDFWINFVRPPWLPVSLSVQTAWTFSWRNLGKFSWDNALLGHLLELSKGAVSKVLMESHEGGKFGLQEGFVLVILRDESWVHCEISGDSLGFRALWLICGSVRWHQFDGCLNWRFDGFIHLVIRNERGGHATKGSECSKLLIARSCKANANVTLVQGSIIVSHVALFSRPLEGDGVSRDRAACFGISLRLALLGDHLWDEDVDRCFR